MMSPQSFDSVVEVIVQEDPRYKRGAYQFVREALEHTIKNLDTGTSGFEGEHVSGKLLLEGIKDYALIQYGPMSKTLLNNWNVTKCEDFGEIVFNLVDKGVFGKTNEDSREDFKGAYTFDEAFVKPFLPKGKGNSRN